MSTLNSTDLSVRLQRLGCCIGDKTKKLAKSLLYGSRCKEEQEKELIILNAYAELLKCYNVNHSTSLDNIYTANFNFFDKGSYIFSTGARIQIFISGVEVVDYTTTSSTITTELNAIIPLLEANTTIVVDATRSGMILAIQTYCQYTNIFVKYTYVSGGVTTEYFIPVQINQQGYCVTGDSDNCVTEDTINTIIDDISERCDICFKPQNYGYKS